MVVSYLKFTILLLFPLVIKQEFCYGLITVRYLVLIEFQLFKYILALKKYSVGFLRMGWWGN